MEILTGILGLLAIAILFHVVIEHTWLFIAGCVVAYVIYAYHAEPLVGGTFVAAYAVFIGLAPFILLWVVAGAIISVFGNKGGKGNGNLS
jgi:hypothetical protein